VKSSGAVVKVFRHNDMAHLEKLLRFHIAEGQARTHRPWKKVRARVGDAPHAASD
jgi:serine palmitoyltransferase